MSNTLHVDVDALKHLSATLHTNYDGLDSGLILLRDAYNNFDYTFLSQDKSGFEARFHALFFNLTNAKREADELLPFLRQLEQDAQTTEGVKF